MRSALRPAASVTLLLLRHGEVASHRGDTPLTEQGRDTAAVAGRRLSQRFEGRLTVLSSATLRARETAALLADEARLASNGASVGQPRVAFGLRNPDLYVAGDRVDMVSSPEALADQVPGLSATQCAELPFFAEFMRSPDRVGWWLRHPAPPGDDAATVAARTVAFARSLLDLEPRRGDLVVGVTHSPVLRAVALRLGGRDPGEPRHLTGFALHPTRDGSPHAEPFDLFARARPAV